MVHLQPSKRRKRAEADNDRIQLFAKSEILEENEFDDDYHEHKMPRLPHHKLQHGSAVQSAKTSNDEGFAIAFDINDPVDAAILAHSPEDRIVLQALETLLSIAGGRLDPGLTELRKWNLDANKDDLSNAPASKLGNHELQEDDDYFKATLVTFRVIFVLRKQH